ncbi:MAG: ribosomal protein L29 [Candidatus Paceibacteria bacterium]|jgi:ribosomal protein L29
MIKQFEKKSDKDLVKELASKQSSIREFRFGMSGSRTRNVKESSNLRKEVARIKAELNERSKKAVNK